MRLAAISLLLALSVVSCTSDDMTRETLAAHGFSNIEVGGYAFFACSDSDRFQTKFTATNAQGVRVNGVVCCGLFKSCTVRF